MRSAADEYFGGGLDLGDPGTPFALPLPYGQGSNRFLRVAHSTGTTRTLVLPAAAFLVDGTGLTAGGQPQYVIWNASNANIIVRTFDLSVIVATIPAGSAGRIFLLSTFGNPFGVWSSDVRTGAEGTPMPIDVEHFELELVECFNFNLFNELVRRFRDRFSGAKPVRVAVTLNGYIGGDTETDVPAFDTGGLPPGSLVTLVIRAGAGIIGAGGEGGAGWDLTTGNVLPAPTNGKTALTVRDDVLLLNYGLICGGGGGGSGAQYVTGGSGGGGSGGGGGAGLPGGAGGIYGRPGGNAGKDGTMLVRGQGGAGSAPGGLAPLAGAPGGLLGGDGGTLAGSTIAYAGPAIRRKTGKTITSGLAGGGNGIVLGPQVTF